VIVLSKLLDAKTQDGKPLFHIWLLMMEYSRTVCPEFEGVFTDDEEYSFIDTKVTVTVSGPKRSKTDWSVGMHRRSDGWWVDGEDGRDGEDKGVGMFDFDDKRHCREYAYMGNSASRIENWYYAAAIVFRPV
jgi:hypothetical protein